KSNKTVKASPKGASLFTDHSTTFKKHITIVSNKKIPDILEFIDKIYKSYLEKQYPVPQPKLTKAKVVKQPRHYYVKETWRNEFKRWELESRTSFEHIFFPGKDKFLRRLDKFMKREIPLAKFTILLHGPPGGGKTSF